MKKIFFISLFVAISISSFAQNLSLSYPGGVISDGGSVVFSTPANVAITSGQKVIFVHNNGAADATVICTKEIIDTIAGTENAFCWGGGCYTPAVITSPSSALIAAGDSTATDICFSGDYNANGHVGDSHIRYIFTNTVNHESVSVVVTYNATPAGVNAYAQNSFRMTLSPNPASNFVNVDCSLLTNVSSITVKNLLGAVVFTSELSGSNAKISINTTDFTDGIYFVTTMSNGTPLSTKKLVVRH